jgi:hypothetical protein
MAKLIDDPFRSLAGELRRAGGFAKDTTPFSEFLWADFLRRRVKRKTVETQHPPSRSWMSAECTRAWSSKPWVSTRMLGFLPLIFFPAS